MLALGKCRRITVGFVALMLALAAGLYLVLTRLTPPAEPAAHIAPEAVETLFAARLADTTGRPQALADWRGKVLVVNFWASWCPPCREEIPGFSRLQRKYRDSGVQFVGIAVENKQKVVDFVAHLPIGYPILVADSAGNELMRPLGNTSLGLPYTVVVDRSGKIGLTHLGRLAETRLDELLQQTVR